MHSQHVLSWRSGLVFSNLRLFIAMNSHNRHGEGFREGVGGLWICSPVILSSAESGYKFVVKLHHKRNVLRSVFGRNLAELKQFRPRNPWSGQYSFSISSYHALMSFFLFDKVGLFVLSIQLLWRHDRVISCRVVIRMRKILPIGWSYFSFLNMQNWYCPLYICTVCSKWWVFTMHCCSTSSVS